MEHSLCVRLEKLIEAELEEIAEAAEHRRDGLSKTMIANMHCLVESMAAIKASGNSVTK